MAIALAYVMLSSLLSGTRLLMHGSMLIFLCMALFELLVGASLFVAWWRGHALAKRHSDAKCAEREVVEALHSQWIEQAPNPCVGWQAHAQYHLVPDLQQLANEGMPAPSSPSSSSPHSSQSGRSSLAGNCDSPSNSPPPVFVKSPTRFDSVRRWAIHQERRHSHPGDKFSWQGFITDKTVDDLVDSNNDFTVSVQRRVTQQLMHVMLKQHGARQAKRYGQNKDDGGVPMRLEVNKTAVTFQDLIGRTTDILEECMTLCPPSRRRHSDACMGRV